MPPQTARGASGRAVLVAHVTAPADGSASVARGLVHQVQAHQGEKRRLGEFDVLVLETSTLALRLALWLRRNIAQDENPPAIRFGIHAVAGSERPHGQLSEAVEACCLAADGQILLTPAARATAHRVEPVAFEECRLKLGRDAGKRVLFDARPEGEITSVGAPIDPVCRMALGREAGSLLYRGVRSHFCSLKCAELYAISPERYVDRVEPPRPWIQSGPPGTDVVLP